MDNLNDTPSVILNDIPSVILNASEESGLRSFAALRMTILIIIATTLVLRVTLLEI